MKKYLLVLLLAIFIIPSIAFASWWNPFSWNWFGWFNKNNTVQQTEQITQTQNPNNNTPINQNSNNLSTSPSLSKNQVYSNEYLTVTIPSGWTAKEATYQTCVNEGPCTQASLSKASKTVLDPTAVDITKGNYIFSIETQVGQASGIQGGRFPEYAHGLSEAAVTSTNQGEWCSTPEKENYYISSDDSTDCSKPTNGKTVWYFSDFGGGINYIPNTNNNGDTEPMGWTATMSYNSKDINSFPVKGSDDLNQALAEASDIFKTFKLKSTAAPDLTSPLSYVPIPPLFGGFEWKNETISSESRGLAGDLFNSDTGSGLGELDFKGTEWISHVVYPADNNSSVAHNIDSQIYDFKKYYDSQLNGWTSNQIETKIGTGNYLIVGPSAGIGCDYYQSYLKIQDQKLYDVTIGSSSEIDPNSTIEGPCEGKILSYILSVSISDPVDISTINNIKMLLKRQETNN